MIYCWREDIEVSGSTRLVSRDAAPVWRIKKTAFIKYKGSLSWSMQKERASGWKRKEETAEKKEKRKSTGTQAGG